MANDLLIKINADAKNAEKAFDDLRKETEDLEGQLKSIALISGAAFAALTAEIFFSVKAFEEARQSSVQLTNALQNQGIFTEELKAQYEGYAEAVQAKTGIDNDAILKAQAVAQTYLGQQKITQQLTQSIADLSATMGGDLNGAAEKIAKTIGTGVNAFARQGLVIDASASSAERYAKVLEFVQLKAGGLSEEFNKADGYSKALTTSFGNFQEAIGARFAPIVEGARKIVIKFFDAFTNNPVLADLAVAAIAGATAVTGLITAVALGVPAFLALKAAVLAFGTASNFALAGIPLAIGAIVAAATFLALNWEKSMAIIKASSAGAVTFISELFSGLGGVLAGVFTLNADKVQKGLDQITGAYKKAKDETLAVYKEVTDAQRKEQEIQDADKKAAADKAAAKEREHQANLRAIRAAEIQLLRLQNQYASQEIIALKQREIETLKALDSDKSKEEMALYQERLSAIRELEEEKQAEDIERQIAFAQLQAETKAELDAQGIEIDAQLREDKLAALRAQALTEADIDRQLQETILNKRIQSRNQELIDRRKYGEVIAKLNLALNTDEVQGVKTATAELIQLQQSKNQTLKTIGKAAAVTDITIKTAQSAMNIFEGFSTIPIIGPALGVVAAAAAVAFGAERIGQVTAAADGGLITGGIPGRDSVPALLEPGELVVPKRNFNDVVGAIQNDGGNGNEEMLATLKSIDEKISTPQTTIIQGDVFNDDSFIDSLVRKISDAVEFRNAQIFGVTT